MTELFRFRKVVGVAAVLTPLVAAAPATAASCFDDWSDAAPVMLEQGLLGTKELHEQARHHLPGDVVRITLCRDGSRFVYRLLMRDPRGRLNTVTLDARHPFGGGR